MCFLRGSSGVADLAPAAVVVAGVGMTLVVKKEDADETVETALSVKASRGLAVAAVAMVEVEGMKVGEI